MVDYRLVIDPAETPRATAERLVQRRLLDIATAGVARLLGHAEERARYAQRPRRRRPASWARSPSVRRALAARAGRWVRLMAPCPPAVGALPLACDASPSFGLKMSRRTSDASLAVRRVLRPILPRRLSGKRG